MYNMNQFIVVVSIPDQTSATLASHFMQHVLMKFDFFCLIVLDNSTPFKGSFIAMCQYLNINYDVLAKRNHITIAVEKRGTNDIFVPTSIATDYAWNSSPIDDTYILCSILASCREVNFPIGINLNALP